MGGNVTSVTSIPAGATTPAGASTPSVPRFEAATSPGAPAPSGNGPPAGGETLPVAPPVADIAQAVEKLNDIMSSKQRSLRFQLDEGSGRTIITVINKTTHEVIRQIPSEELLAIAQHMEQLGTLIDTRI